MFHHLSDEVITSCQISLGPPGHLMNNWIHPAVAAAAPPHIVSHVPSFPLSANMQSPLQLLSYIETVRKLGMLNNIAAPPTSTQPAASTAFPAAAEQIPACHMQVMQNLMSLSNNPSSNTSAAPGYTAQRGIQETAVKYSQNL